MRAQSRLFTVMAATAAVAAGSVVMAVPSALAATTVVNESAVGVTWGPEIAAGGSATFVAAQAPSGLGAGALRLRSPGASDKAALFTLSGVPLSQVTQLGYWNKTLSGASGIAAAAYKIAVDVNGAASGGFTTLVYEPYQSAPSDPANGVWEYWDVDQGTFWSTGAHTSLVPGGTNLEAGGGGPAIYSLQVIKDSFPDAVVLYFGPGVGSNNAGFDVLVDGVEFNGTTYDFESTVLDGVLLDDPEMTMGLFNGSGLLEYYHEWDLAFTCGVDSTITFTGTGQYMTLPTEVGGTAQTINGMVNLVTRQVTYSSTYTAGYAYTDPLFTWAATVNMGGSANSGLVPLTGSWSAWGLGGSILLPDCTPQPVVGNHGQYVSGAVKAGVKGKELAEIAKNPLLVGPYPG